MKDKIMNGLMGFAMFLQNQRHFAAIKNAFSGLLPIIIVGSFCTLISNVVCNTNPGYLSLANVPGMAWLGSLSPMFTAANYGTMNQLRYYELYRYRTCCPALHGAGRVLRHQR